MEKRDEQTIDDSAAYPRDIQSSHAVEESLFVCSACTDMQETMKARLRESRLLAPSGRWGEFTLPSRLVFVLSCMSVHHPQLISSVQCIKLRGRD